MTKPAFSLGTEDPAKMDSASAAAELAALAAERDALYRLRYEGNINDITMRRILADIDLTEASLRSGRRNKS